LGGLHQAPLHQKNKHTGGTGGGTGILDYLNSRQAPSQWSTTSGLTYSFKSALLNLYRLIMILLWHITSQLGHNEITEPRIIQSLHDD